MRILHIVSSLSKSSGVMKFIMSYSEELTKQDIKFDFLYWVDDEINYKEEISRLGGSIFKIAKPSLSKKSYNEVKGFFLNNSKKFESVHLHELYLNALICPIAKKNGIKKIISHAHTTKFSDKRLNALRNRLLCITLNKNSDSIMACSTQAGQLYFKSRFNKDGVVIPNAIDLKKYTFDKVIRNKYRLELNLDGKFVMCHIGRFNLQKNHTFLIRIFEEVYKENQNSTLLLVGEGPLRKKIKDSIKNKKYKNNIQFLGVREDISSILMASDVFILPSLFEGLGIVLIEAQATGLSSYYSDNVPNEVCINSNMTSISLKKSPKVWKRQILNDRETNSLRKVSKRLFEEYDIKNNINLLYSIYTSKTK